MRNWHKFLKENWVLIVAILGLVFLKIGMPFLLSDDANLYMYIGKLVSEGATPYKDFQIGHPPLMFYTSAFFFNIFGTTLMVGRIVPMLSGIGILIFSYLLAEKTKPGLGNMAIVFLFFAPHFQIFTNSLLGASLNLFFLLGSYYFLTEKKDILAGVFFVLAALSRYSAFPFFLLILVYVVLKKRYKFLYGIGAMLPILIWIFRIPNFFEYTIIDMTARNILGSSKLVGIFDFVISQIWVVGIGIGGGYLVFNSKTPKKVNREMLEWSAYICASIILTLMLREVRSWYIFYSLPFLCILGAYFVKNFIDKNEKAIKWGTLLLLGFLIFWSFAPVLGHSDSTVAEEILVPLITPGMVVYDVSGTRGAYMAMKYGTRIPKELIDNNAIGLASGVRDPKEVVGHLENSMPTYIIDYRQDERTTYWMNTEIGTFVQNNYYPHTEAVEENTGNSLVIWERQ